MDPTLALAAAVCVLTLCSGTKAILHDSMGRQFGSNSGNSTCMCATVDVYASTTACTGGATFGLLRRGSCIISKGAVQTSCGHTWVNFIHKGQDAWVPKQSLNEAENSDCLIDDSIKNLTDLVPTQQCLGCICYVEGCQPGCHMDVGSLSCGYFQIKKAYYEDCGSPGSDWQSCANDKACTTQCVIAYMQRYATRCTGGRTPTCEDYSKIHNGGPMGCRKGGAVEQYWERVKLCLGSR